MLEMNYILEEDIASILFYVLYLIIIQYARTKDRLKYRKDKDRRK